MATTIAKPPAINLSAEESRTGELRCSKAGVILECPGSAAGTDIGKISGSRTTVWRDHMLKTYTAKYTRITTGYMGQLIEWPEVITEGKSLEDCRGFLQDALREMILAYRQQQKEIPVGGGLIEQLPVEI
jgi:predicted RNase H-like HicB family nuclease